MCKTQDPLCFCLKDKIKPLAKGWGVGSGQSLNYIASLNYTKKISSLLIAAVKKEWQRGRLSLPLLLQRSEPRALVPVCPSPKYNSAQGARAKGAFGAH